MLLAAEDEGTDCLCSQLPQAVSARRLGDCICVPSGLPKHSANPVIVFVTCSLPPDFAHACCRAPLLLLQVI
jgi:hypothetical protein